MSEEFAGVVWRAGMPDAHGDQFTTKALEEMAKQMHVAQRVTFNFDFRRIIGRVKRAWVTNDSLYMRVSIDDPEAMELLRTDKAVMRPGFGVTASHVDTGGVHVIDSIGDAFVSVTPNPIMPLPGDQDGS